MSSSTNVCRRFSIALATVVFATSATSHRIDAQESARLNEARSLASADSTWNAGHFADSRALYQTVLAINPNSPRPIFRIATLLAWDNRLDEAIHLFKRYIELQPRDNEGRLALARAYAWSGRYPSAIAIYDSLLAKDAGNRDAVLGRAQTLAWDGRLDEALDVYKQWGASHPGDSEATVGYARTLSWAGRLEDAEALYVKLANAGDANAQRGLARVRAWRGNLQDSETAWRQLLDRRPNDPEALTGLAEVLRWQGRETEAADALSAALRTDPTYGDARALLRWVRADMRPSFTVTASGENDSDDNRAAVLRADYVARAPWKGSIGARYIHRSANFAAIDSRAEAGDVFARWQPGSWDFRADAGVTHHSSSFVPTTPRSTSLWSGAFNVAGIVSRILDVGASITRAPFDETALLIASGISSTEVGGEAGVLLPRRFKFSVAGSEARLTGGTRENTRLAYSSTLRWAYNRRLSLAVGGRRYGYDTTSADGYFAPKQYTLAEVSGRAAVGGQLGWTADADVGVGRQQIDFFGSSVAARLAERAALAAGYRFDPSHEVGIAASYANVAAPGQTSGGEYKAWAFSLRARLGL